MGKGGKKDPKDRTVCFCYIVSEAEIVAALEAGASTLMEIRRFTNANTGCGGCGQDVKKLIAKHAKKAHKKNQGDSD